VSVLCTKVYDCDYQGLTIPYAKIISKIGLLQLKNNPFGLLKFVFKTQNMDPLKGSKRDACNLSMENFRLFVFESY